MRQLFPAVIKTTARFFMQYISAQGFMSAQNNAKAYTAVTAGRLENHSLSFGGQSIYCLHHGLKASDHAKFRRFLTTAIHVFIESSFIIGNTQPFRR